MFRLACSLVFLAVLPHLVGQDKTDKKVEEIQTVEFSARIVDSAGRAIEGAGLALFKKSETKDSHRCRTEPVAKSDADGKITFTIRRATKDRRTWLLAAKKRTSLVLRVRPTKTTKDGVDVYRADLGDVVMSDGVSVLGLVRDRDGKPVAGAKVTTSSVLDQLLVNRQRGVTHATVCYGVSDAKGRVRLSGIPPHGVGVKITAKGYYAWSTGYLNRHTPMVATLDKGGHVSGIVLSSDGKPVKGARVYAYSEATERSEGKTTKDDGRFEFDLPGKGRYRLRYYAKLDGASRYTYEYTKILSEPQQDLELRFGTGALDQQGNPIVKAAAAAAAGKSKGADKVLLRIVDAKTGVALRAARAAVLWWPPNNWQHNPGYLERQLDNKKKDEKLDERGTLRLSGPVQNQPDTGRIIVAAKGYAPNIIMDVEWEEDGKNEFRVKMHKESSVAGVVVDPQSGKPLPGVQVIAVTDPSMLRNYNPLPVRRKLDGTRSAVTTDDDGAFRIGELADGEVQIYVAHKERADAPPTPVELKPAGSVEGLRIEYPKGGSLLGKITGTPARPGWQVRIRRMPAAGNRFGATWGLSANQQYESAGVSTDGGFVFHGLSRANYLLSLMMPSSHGAVEIPMEPIRMRTKNVERSFDISEDMPGRLAGQVKIEGGAFTPGRLMLVAENTKTANPYAYNPGRLNLQGDFALLDGRGRFDLPVAEGRYYLKVIDLMTRLTLFQGIRAVHVRPTETTQKDVIIKVAPVTLELKPEKEGEPIHITKIEIVAEHPKPPKARNFGVVFGQSNRYSGVGLTVPPGETRIQLILPAVPCKLLARSDAHNLDPKMNRYNFPAQGEVELTPEPGQSNRVEIEVSAPQINLDGEKPAAKAAAGAVRIIRKR